MRIFPTHCLSKYEHDLLFKCNSPEHRELTKQLKKPSMINRNTDIVLQIQARIPHHGVESPVPAFRLVVAI